MTTDFETLIVGAGFSGLCVASRLKRAGVSSFAVLEKEHAVGGAWRDNSYPGCACDVPSALYSLSCSTEWAWTRRYARQPEILHYLRGFVSRNNLESHLRYDSEVTHARWDESRGIWIVGLGNGTSLCAEKLILAMGGLHLPSLPAIDGLQRFEGPSFHSARWNHAIRLEGKRVALIGNGASGVQVVPEIAPIVSQLDVYQRTPAWIFPRKDHEIVHDQEAKPRSSAIARLKHYAVRELLTLTLRKPGIVVSLFERAAHAHLKSQVKNPVLREALTPRYALGCKRILLSSNYYPAISRENVSLVTTAIARASAQGIVTVDGRERPADILIFATGFKPNGFPAVVKVSGVDGMSLNQAWSRFPSSYLGISTAGFPNLFFMSGPNTGLGHSSVLLMIEAQASHIVGAHEFMRRSSCNRLEVRQEVQNSFVSEMQRRLSTTVWQAGRCSSWYQSENGENVALWPGLSSEYVRRARRFSPHAYSSSALSANRAPHGNELTSERKWRNGHG